MAWTTPHPARPPPSHSPIGISRVGIVVPIRIAARRFQIRALHVVQHLVGDTLRLELGKSRPGHRIHGARCPHLLDDLRRRYAVSAHLHNPIDGDRLFARTTGAPSDRQCEQDHGDASHECRAAHDRCPCAFVNRVGLRRRIRGSRRPRAGDSSCTGIIVPPFSTLDPIHVLGLRR